ncbi:hypothetical protein RCL1_007711 [Eukaryota sp. TZLM3-RCL]
MPDPQHIGFNSDGTVRESTQAVRSGEIKTTESGGISEDSPMVQRGEARVTKDGSLDDRYKSGQQASYAVDPSEVTAKHLRDQPAQDEYRSSHSGDSEKDVAHYVGLDPGSKMLQHRPGPHLTQEQYESSAGNVLNDPANMRMVDSDTNRIGQRSLEREQSKAIQDPEYQMSAPAQQRSELGARRMDKVAEGATNPTEASMAQSFGDQLRDISQR